jgi:predicted enzyme related to lactoylglutathione lyase
MAGTHGDVSYVVLAVPDVHRAEAFYGGLFGWAFEHGRVPSCSPKLGLTRDPVWPGARLSYQVDDVAAAVETVLARRGQSSAPVDRGYALEAECHDPLGLPFWLHQFPARDEAPSTAGLSAGDIARVSLYVPDADEARVFYAAVLGWSYAEGNPVGTTPAIDISRGSGRPGVVLGYAIDDLDAAVGRVRSLGGTALAPGFTAAVPSSLCTDAHSLSFYLCQQTLRSATQQQR